MKESSAVLYRRSPYLVVYWQQDGLVVENYATQVRVIAAPIILQVLQFFDRWRSADAWFGHMQDFSRPALRRALAELVKNTFLQRSDRPWKAGDRALRRWQEWTEAAAFHFSTKDIAYENDKATDLWWRRRGPGQALPLPVKRYPRASQVALPAPASGGELPRVLRERRTWRQFSTRPLQLAALGTLLGLTWGVQRWIKLPGRGRVALKTSPSGGALHPIEAYVLALRVSGLPRGLYHYSAHKHCLELLRRGASRAQVMGYLAGQRWFGGAAAIVVMTAVFRRAQWKYQSSRAYRVVLAEAGHLCQTFCLLATWLRLAPFCTMALADSRLEKDLGVDGVSESVLYVAGVGTRPREQWNPLTPPRPRL